VSEVSVRLVQAALLGPVVAAAAWLGLAWWPWLRRAIGGVLALAAHAAAWGVFWLMFQGEPVAWRGFQPTLLGATVVVAAELGIALALVRAELRRPSTAAAVGLTVSATAVVVAAYSGSLAAQAVFLALPTVATAVAGLESKDLRGVAGLAAADVVALVALSVLHARTDSALLGQATGLGPGLLLVAAAVKVGAVPGLGTWRLEQGGGPAASMGAALRGQGMALAAVAGVVMARGQAAPVLVGVFAALMLVSGAAAVLGRTRPTVTAGVLGAGAGVPLLALALGGGAGVRGFLVVFPPMLLAASAATLLDGQAAPEARPMWRRLGVAGLAVVALSLTGLPPGGGFPGTWLALSVAAERGQAQHLYLAAAAAAALGLALAALGGVALVRSVRARAAAAILGSLSALALLYVGLQPVRLGVGWWLRVERELALPLTLPATGIPDLPAIGVINLALVLAEAALLVGVVVLLGRGFREVPAVFEAPPRAQRPVARRRGEPVRRVLRVPAAAVARARSAGAGLGLAAVLEAATVVLAVRLVFLAARGGFL
jgi:hypothetical protein